MERKRLIKTAFLGLVERFQDSLFLLSYTFGWRLIWDTTRPNATPEKDDREPIDPETISRIRDSLKLDMELYQFGQDIFESRFNDMTKTLLQRYGKKSHASLCLPLLADVIFQLLEQHYVDRRDFRARQEGNPADEYLYRPMMKVDRPFGWNNPDFPQKHGRMCWLGPGLQSEFDLPCPFGTNIQISFRVLMALHPATIKQLSLTVDSIQMIRDHSVDSEEAFIFTGDIPLTAFPRRFLRLVFIVPMTIVADSKYPSNHDPRQVGFLLNCVKLQSH